MENDDKLVDAIYEAAFVPELWNDVLESVCRIGGCFGGVLFAVDSHQNVRSVVTDQFQPIWELFLKGRWNERNIRRDRLARLNYAGFVTDHDLLSDEEIDSHPFYKDFMRPNGGGWGTGTLIPIPSNDLLVFNLERRFSEGPVDQAVCGRLDRLRAHLARSGLLSLRFQMERARATVATLEHLGLAAAVIGTAGRVLAANKLLLKLDDQIVIGAFDTLSMISQSANDLFKQSLSKFQGNVGSHGAKSIPVPATGESAARIAHLIPVRGVAHDIFSAAKAIMVVTPLQGSQGPPAEVLNGLFDLTPAEARITLGLVAGKTLEDLAKEQGVTKHTIRNQLKSVFLKTGTKRQSELVGLLSGTQSFELRR